MSADINKSKSCPCPIAPLPLENVVTRSAATISLWLGGTIILSLIFRLGYLFEITANPLVILANTNDVFDQSRFMNLAKGFLQGNWLGTDTAWFSPSYSYFIAVILKYFGNNFYFVFWAQTLMGLASIVIVYKTAALLFKNDDIGLLTAGLFAFYGPFVFYECKLLRDSPITYLNLAGFYFLLCAFRYSKKRFYIFSAIALGGSALLRPQILPLFVIIYILAANTTALKQRIKYALLFSLTLIIAISPLPIRNKMAGNNVLLSSQGSSVFWIGNTFDASGIGLYRSPLREKLANEAAGNFIKTVKIFIREVNAHPNSYKKIYLQKIKMFLNGYEIPSNLSFDHFRESSFFLKLFALDFTFISPLALLGMILCRRKYPNSGLAYLFLGVMSLSVIIMHILGRYRLPATPFFIIFASYALYWLIQMLKEHRLLPLSYALSALFIFSLYTMPDQLIMKKYFGDRIRPSDYFNSAYAHYLLYRSKEKYLSNDEKKLLLIRITDDLEKSLIRIPPKAREFKTSVLVSLASTYAHQGQMRKAKEVLHQSLRLSPGNPNLMDAIDKSGLRYLMDQ